MMPEAIISCCKPVANEVTCFCTHAKKIVASFDWFLTGDRISQLSPIVLESRVISQRLLVYDRVRRYVISKMYSSNARCIEVDDFFFPPRKTSRSNEGKKFCQTHTFTFPVKIARAARITRNSSVVLRRMCNDLAGVIFIGGSRE